MPFPSIQNHTLQGARMSILTDGMKRLVTEQRLGFVATVNADGSPNLSPKGTMVVLDDDHIAFGEIRSPNTIRNLLRHPIMEINFVDPFVRKGYRFRGKADIVSVENPQFNSLFPYFAQWGELSKKIRAIVKIHVTLALPLVSPAYDV